MLTASFPFTATEIPIPPRFRDGRPIEQIILISDVDGVVRRTTDVVVDPRVIDAVKSLLHHPHIDITFLSGSPIKNELAVDLWDGGNLPLKPAFGTAFENELREQRVGIYGVLGGQQLNKDGTVVILDEYSSEIAWELQWLLVKAFLREAFYSGNSQQQDIAKSIYAEFKQITRQHETLPRITAPEFYLVVDLIRKHLDANFRLLCYGGLIETHTSSPPWSTALSTAWLKKVLDSPNPLMAELSPIQKKIATGLVKNSIGEFNYLSIAKINKGITSQKLIAAKLAHLPNALIVTIGDTQVDYPMHENADLAFHVGLEKVWANNPLPQCVMIRNAVGEDCQHVEGTLKVLQLLNAAIGKSFYDLPSLSQWNTLSGLQWKGVLLQSPQTRL